MAPANDVSQPGDPAAANLAVALVVLMRNEASSLPSLVASIAALQPQPNQVLAVDGDSTDQSVAIAEAAGFQVIQCLQRGRAAGINAGVAQAWPPLVCILHADTLLPADAIALIRGTMVRPDIALAGFTSLLCGPAGIRWGTSFHNWIKTWYAPLLFRPVLFCRGLRLLFGDHAMFFRKSDFVRIGGCDETMMVMEDADLCVRLSRVGRVRLLSRVVTTSDRRVAQWGSFRANWTFLRVAVGWALGIRRGRSQTYQDVR